MNDCGETWMSLATFGTFLTRRIERVLGVGWNCVTVYDIFGTDVVGLCDIFTLISFSCHTHTKMRLILVQFKVGSFCKVTINEVGVVNSGLNGSFAGLLWCSGAPSVCPAFTNSSLEDEGHAAAGDSGMADDGAFCSHGDYPCRFTRRSARSQRVIPHRVFGPVSLLRKAQVEFQQRHFELIILLKLTFSRNDLLAEW